MIADRQLQNMNSSFYKAIKNIYLNAIAQDKETWKDLDAVPGEFNKLKRFYYNSFTLGGTEENAKLISDVKSQINTALTNSLKELRSKPIIENDFL